MAVHLGGKLRRLTKKAKQLGYVKEVIQVWEHECDPPIDKRISSGRHPILSDGDYAEAGTQWACHCGRIWNVYVPDSRSPGIRKWERIRVIGEGMPAHVLERGA